MEKRKLQPGDILQIKPDGPTTNGKRYGGFFLCVTDPKEWGALGFLLSPINVFDELTTWEGCAFLRLTFEEVEYIGKSHYMWEEVEEEGE